MAALHRQRPWGQCARLCHSDRQVSPSAPLLPGPHLLGGWQSWALARHSLAETGFSFGEFLSEAFLWSVCLPWAQFASPSRAGQWVAGRALPRLFTSRWTMVHPGPPAWVLAGPWARGGGHGCLVPSGPPSLLGAVPAHGPIRPSSSFPCHPQGCPSPVAIPRRWLLLVFVTQCRDVSTAPGGTPCGRLHRPHTLQTRLRAQGPAVASSHPRWMGAPCSGALDMVLQAARPHLQATAWGRGVLTRHVEGCVLCTGLRNVRSCWLGLPIRVTAGRGVLMAVTGASTPALLQAAADASALTSASPTDAGREPPPDPVHPGLPEQGQDGRVHPVSAPVCPTPGRPRGRWAPWVTHAPESRPSEGSALPQLAPRRSGRRGGCWDGLG